jgi:hypothetical protein
VSNAAIGSKAQNTRGRFLSPVPSGYKKAPSRGAGMIDGVWMVGFILYPIFPIVRFSVEVCNGDYQDFVLADLVYDPVRETAGLAPPRSL